MSDDPVAVALNAAHDALTAIAAADPARVTAAIPPNEDLARDHPADAAALLAMDTPAGRAFGVRVLARLDPDRAAPLARTITEGLLARANDARIAYLEAADPSVVEACIAESAKNVLVEEPAAPPGERRQFRPLCRAAKTGAEAVALLRERHDGWSWDAIWSLVGIVVQRTEGRKREAMAAIAYERRVQEWLSPMDAAALRQARSALASCVTALPYSEIVGLLERGVVSLGSDQAKSFAVRPELATAEACLALLERQIEFHPLTGAFGTSHEDLARALLSRLGELGHAPAALLISRLLCTHVRLRDNARRALARLPHDVARAAIVEALVELVDRRRIHFDPHHPQRNVIEALEALFSIADTDPFDAAAPFFTGDRLATGPGAALVLQILSLVRGRFAGRAHAVVALLDRPREPPRALTDDPRWLVRLVDLLGHRLLATAAFAALGSFDAALRERALADAVAARPRPLARPAPRAAFSARGRAGVGDAVWDEIRALGPGPFDAATEAEIDAVAEETMRHFLASLEALVPKLRKLKVPLQAKAKVRTAPKATFDADLAKLEKRIGLRLPAALRAFYRIVGGVDLSSPALRTPLPFGGLPLVIVPFRAIAAELTAAAAAHKPIPAALRPPASATIGPELPRTALLPYGDDVPVIAVLAQGVADPPLRGARAPTFVGLLSEALRGGGFVGARDLPKGLAAPG